MSLSADDLAAATDAFWQAQHGAAYPLHLETALAQSDAYRINLALTDRYAAAGKRQSGWKIGLTAKAIQEQFGLPEPLFACLFADDRWPSGSTHSLSALTQPGWENELCLTLGDTLTGPDVTEEQARRAIASVAPAMEIIEGRTPVSPDGLNCLIADNGQNRAYVVGAGTPFDPGSTDLGAAAVEVFVDGVLVDQAAGTAVMESSAVASVVWLANKLAEFDRILEAGQDVMTGSFTRQHTIDRPMTIAAHFAPFGAVQATFD